MSDFVLLLKESEVRDIQRVLTAVSNDFKRDKINNRETMVDELTLLGALNSMKMKSWYFGELSETSSEVKE